MNCKKIVFILSLISLFTSGCSSNLGKKLIGHEAPITLITLTDGSTSALSHYTGKDKVILFWATWCPRSDKVLTRLNLFAKTHRHIPIIAINLDTLELENEARERMKQYPYLVHAFSGNDVYDQAFMSWEGEELPYVAVIDSTDKVMSVSSSDLDVYTLFKVEEPEVE